MSRHHLDPRQAGTGAAADVRVDYCDHPHGPSRGWYFATTALPELRAPGPFDSKQAALCAARAAAGFGDVAEQPCFAFVLPCRADAHFHSAECDTECDKCRWSRDAHKGVQS